MELFNSKKVNTKAKHAKTFLFDMAEERKICNKQPLQFTTERNLSISSTCPFLDKIVGL